MPASLLTKGHPCVPVSYTHLDVYKRQTHGPLFVGLLIGTVLLVGALTFIPALALGPVAEYLS